MQTDRRVSVQMNEQPVLATASTQPFLYEFHGLDDEDFAIFKNAIQDYIAIKNITNTKSKLAILRAKLIGKARQDFDHSCPYIDEPTLVFEDVLEDLTAQYNSDEVMENKRNLFYNIRQLPTESPHNFKNRVYETGCNAGITDQSFIDSRFKFGLLPEIPNHCLSPGAEKTDEFTKFTLKPVSNVITTIHEAYHPELRPVVRDLSIRKADILTENKLQLNDTAKAYLQTEIKDIFRSIEVQDLIKSSVIDAINSAYKS